MRRATRALAHPQSMTLWRRLPRPTENARTLNASRAVAVAWLWRAWKLAADGVHNAAEVVAEAEAGVVVADFFDRLPGDLVDVERELRRDFAADDDQAAADEGFAGDAAGGVVLEDGVEHRVGNVVGDLVGMAFADGLG